MGVSDLITLIGLVFAVVALISERNRDYILLKFTPRDFVFLLCCFLLLNYLIFFKYFILWKVYFTFLIIENFPLAEDWAYLITLGVMVLLIYKLFYAFFPRTNKDKLISYYTNLLHTNDHLTIISLFEKYHKKDLIEHLLYPDRKGVRIEYANNLFWEILSRDDFIAKTANTRPYFYADLIACCTGRNYTNEKFVSNYLQSLLREHNQFLFREIKNNQNFDETGFSYRLPDENRILRALLTDLNLIENNLVWKAFGDCACEEIKDEGKKGVLSFLNESYDDKDGLWQTVTYNSIWFFDIMVRKAVIEKRQSHFWLHYYSYFIDDLLEALEINDINNIDLESEFPTNIHYIIYSIVSNIRYWIKKCEDIENNFHHFDSVRCLCKCLVSIGESEKLTTKFKDYIIGMGIQLYFDVYYFKAIPTIKSNLATEFVENNGDLNYCSSFISAWNKFDKVPFEFHTWGKKILVSFNEEVVAHIENKINEIAADE